MSDDALTPRFDDGDFNRAQRMVYQNGGYDHGGRTYHWYLHHLDEGPTMRLWYGPEEYGQDPMPDPTPDYYVMNDVWNTIKDGHLLENLNWVIRVPNGTPPELYELIAVEINGHREIMAPRIG